MSREKKKSGTVTIYDVAKEADVSLATVSRVLNNTAVVRPERKKRVEEAIKKLSFVPNEIARGLARKSSTSIGIIVSDMTRASVAELISGIVNTANLKQYGYSVSINSFHGEDEVFKTQVDHMISSQIDGLLIMGDSITPAMYDVIKEAQVPVVVFSTPHAYRDLHSIAINYQKVLADIVEYYKKQGNKEVTLLVRDVEDANNLFEEYFMQAANENKISTNVQKLDGEYEKTYETLKSTYSNTKVPTAVIAMSDTLALAYSNAVQDLGHKIPEDTQIISFSNTQASLTSRPQITSVMYPVYRIGAYAMSAITKLIKEDEMPEIDLADKFEIIWRASTK